MPALSLGQLSASERAQRLRGDGLLLRTGPFTFRLRSPLPGVERGLAALYADFQLAERADALADFHLQVGRMPGLRGWVAPQINFWLDGYSPFKPLPYDHGFALLEWGMNWCIAGHAHHYLMLHAACLEKQGQCVILPGDPGAGKSTLTAALMLSGWRLLSDEITLIDRDSGDLLGLGRPVSLKNESIDVIRAFAPQAEWGEPAHDTHKGTVCHLRPTPVSVAQALRPGQAAHIVYPRWRAGAQSSWRPLPRAQSFEAVARNGFNYSLLGRVGFDSIARLVQRTQHWSFEYSKLDEAIAGFEELLA